MISTRSRSILKLTGIVAVTTVLFTGCARGGTDGAASAEDKKTGEGLVIGWSQRGISGSDWWKTLVEGGQAEAEKLGATIQLLDANGDTVRQNADVQTLITKNVDVVIMNPNDPIGVGSSVAALKDAGVPLVTVNSNLDKSLVPDMYCYVAEDQGYTGSLAGEVAAQKAVEKFGDTGEMKIVGIGGFPGDVLSDLRFNGFMDGWEKVMKDHPGVTTNKLETKYGEWKPDKALAPIRDVATANPDLKVTVLEVPFGDVFNKYQLEVASGGGPDLVIVPNDSLGQLTRDELLQPLDALVPADALAALVPLAVEGSKVDGVLMQVPESLKAVAMYYNADKVATPPATTDELLAAV